VRLGSISIKMRGSGNCSGIMLVRSTGSVTGQGAVSSGRTTCLVGALVNRGAMEGEDRQMAGIRT
jgi:hypothetical protein